ncbi:MAG: ribonuclease J [Ureaplasma sp.]|nr:ribonuclease J [Ureaplasma sp.]
MKNKTAIYALGGLEEIGKNTYVVETEKSLVVVDAGIKFTNASMPGFDALVANFDYLKQKEHKIAALIITHGHEDHIGGIPYLLKLVNIKKIIASSLTAQLIMKKVAEHKDITCPEIVVFDNLNEVKLHDIKVEFFRVCHSIPDSFGVGIHTNDGLIVSTGDFRFDFATNADNTDLVKLMQISNKKVDVLLCESTSAEVPGFSESEKYIIKNIEEIIRNAKGRIFLSTFASNLSRIEQILMYVKSLNKKILMLGRSMETNIKISRKLGYLKMTDLDFMISKEFANYPDDEIFVILTGSQGEETAALNAIANGKHPKIAFKPNDTVILSSNPIPGNFAQVEMLVNKLYKLGVNVIENTPEKKIHASGHATRSELQLMIKAINPKYIMPIHGEYKMLKALKQNAIDLGFDEKDIFIAKNGQIAFLEKHKLSLSDTFVDARPMFINSGELNANAQELLETREILSTDGFVLISVRHSIQKGKLISISLTPRGTFLARESTNIITKIINELKAKVNEYWSTHKDYTLDQTSKIITPIVKEFIWKFKRKNPLIYIEYMNMDDVESIIKKSDFIKTDQEEIIKEDISTEDSFNEETE